MPLELKKRGEIATIMNACDVKVGIGNCHKCTSGGNYQRRGEKRYSNYYDRMSLFNGIA